ncbi:MAG TPA: FAD-binding oxidoreductase [Polyangia bacterium]
MHTTTSTPGIVGRTDPITRRQVDLAVVGGGIMGLGIAHELASRGFHDVIVLEGQHLGWGASGRNGGGVRQQWSTELNIRLMQESVALCRSFAQRMNTNIWMRQGGYLFLAKSDKQLQRMEKAIALQNRCDVPTRLLSIGEAQRIVPEMDPSPFVGAAYNPTDGIVFPWPFLWGDAQAAARAGVEIHTETPVPLVERTHAGFRLHTHKGTVEARRLLAATGAFTPPLAAQLGVQIPTWPARHEILSTEGLKPFLTPMVSVLDSGLYFSQSLRGELVGGISLPEPRQTEVRLDSSLAFLEAMGRGMLEVIPRLGHVKVVRQWAGPYDMSPDGDPLVGELAALPGFFVCCGFVGHGFMMAPIVARHLAARLLGDAPHPLFAAWRPDRFADGPVRRRSNTHGELDIG